MRHFLLLYELADDYLDRRAPLRSEHLRLAWEAVEREELLLAGALAEPADGGVFLFQGEGPEGAESFARSDPYVREGLVRSWKVRPWMTVVGEGASNPVRG